MKIKSVLKFTLLLAVALPCTYGYAYNSGTSNSNSTTTQTTQQATVPDHTITKNVKKHIADDKAVSKLHVTVDTKDGIVILTGNVDTDEQASALIEKAAATKGIKDVDATKIVVKQSKQPYTDLIITAKVKGAFLREQLFGKKTVPVMSIVVETTNGTVYLSGTAANQKQADTAVELAKTVSGVNTVETTVKAKS